MPAAKNPPIYGLSKEQLLYYVRKSLNRMTGIADGLTSAGLDGSRIEIVVNEMANNLNVFERNQLPSDPDWNPIHDRPRGRTTDAAE